MRERPQLFGTRAHVHAHRPCANSSKVTRLKKNTHLAEKLQSVSSAASPQAAHVNVCWMARSFPQEKTSYTVWRLITEREPNFSAYYLFFFSFFFGNWSVRDVQHWRLKWWLVDRMSQSSNTPRYRADWAKDCDSLNYSSELNWAC